MEDHHIKIDMGFAGCCRFMLYASSDAYVGFTACIWTAPPAAQGRVPVFAVRRWPAEMRLIPDFETSMTAM